MGEHERHNREVWDGMSDWYQQTHGRRISAAPDAWGTFRIPESELQLLPDVAGLGVLELGCGSGQWSVWLASQGARVTGLDISGRQLDHAHQAIASAGVR